MDKISVQDTASVLDAARVGLCQLQSGFVIPKAKRGRPSLGIRGYVRKNRGGEHGIAYIYGADGKPRSISIPGNKKEDIDLAVDIERNIASARKLGIVNPDQTTLGEILEHEKVFLHPGPQGTVGQFRAYHTRIMKLDRVVDFIGRDLPVRLLNKMRCREYEKAQVKKPARPGTSSKEKLKPATLRVDLSWLRRAVGNYMGEHGHQVTVTLHIPPRSMPRQNWLDRADIAILVTSALKGWYWDPDATREVKHVKTDPVTKEVTRWTETKKGNWKTEEVVDPETGETIRRRIVDPSYRLPEARNRANALARTILIAFYTGTRIGRLRCLVWQRHPNFGWIDTVRGTITRAGIRTPNWGGPGKPPKPAGTAYLPRPLLSLARAWRRADGKVGARKFIIRKPDGDMYANGGSLTSRLKLVGARCGYPDVIMHEMRHSTVTVCLLNGCSVGDVAAFVDVSVEMVQKVYGHLAEEGTLIGAAAMGRKGSGEVSPSREMALDLPPELMTPTDAMARRGEPVRLRKQMG